MNAEDPGWMVLRLQQEGQTQIPAGVSQAVLEMEVGWCETIGHGGD